MDKRLACRGDMSVCSKYVCVCAACRLYDKDRIKTCVKRWQRRVCKAMRREDREHVHRLILSRAPGPPACSCQSTTSRGKWLAAGQILLSDKVSGRKPHQAGPVDRATESAAHYSLTWPGAKRLRGRPSSSQGEDPQAQKCSTCGQGYLSQLLILF